MLKDIYEGDKAGFDAALKERENTLLSRENDRVDGLESLYNFILSNEHHHLASVTGNESFIDWVKQTTASFIQTIRDFFKWLWSFFSGKKVATELGIHEAKRRVAEKGVTNNDVPYPAGVGLVYPLGSGKIANNLNWVDHSIDDLAKSAQFIADYAGVVRTFCEDVKQAPEGTTTEHIHRLTYVMENALKSMLKPDAEGAVFFIRPKGMLLIDNGQRITYNNALRIQPRIKGATFMTSTDQVTKLLTKLETMMTGTEPKFKKVHELEDKMVAAVNAVLIKGTRNEVDRTYASAVRVSLNAAMANIRALETVFENATGALLRVIKAGIKKG